MRLFKNKCIRNNILSFVIGGLISLTITISATVVLNSNQLSYKDGKSVESAVNELYQKYYASPKYMKDIGCDDCTKLNYLKSTGTQYINTLLVSSYTTSVLIEVGDNYDVESDEDGYIFGNDAALGARFPAGGGIRVGFSTATWQTNYCEVLSKNTLYLSNNKSEFNESSIVAPLGNSYSKIGIFATLNTSGNPVHIGQVKIYTFKMYDNNTLIRDYIPVLDKNDRPCLFDKVSKECFYNNGTGEFLYG